MKKRITFLVFSLLLTNSLIQAQTRQYHSGKTRLFEKAQPDQLRLDFRQENDTLFAEAFQFECADSLAGWLSDEWGFVGGTNNFGDREKAQKLTFGASNNLSVQEVWGFFVSATTVGDGDLRAKIYSESFVQGPGNLLGTSTPLKTSQIQLDDEFLVPTIFTFPNPVGVAGNSFYASIDFTDLYAARDTAGLWMFSENCGNADDSWELWDDGNTWLPISSEDTWFFDSDFAIASVIEFGETVVTEFDTLVPPSFELECGNTVVGWSIEDWGFVGGTNSLLDLEKAQRLRFDAADGVLVQEVWGFFIPPSLVGDGQLQAKIYDINLDDGGPANLLGISNTLNVSDIPMSDQVPLPTIFTFDEPVMVEGEELFASIDFSELYSTLDTVGLWMSDEDCGDGADAWELWEGGTLWVPVNDEDGWNFNSNFLIFAVVELQNLSNVQSAFVTQRGLTLRPAFPNPAREQVTIPFELENATRTMIELYSAEGKLLRQMDLGVLPPGPHQQLVSTGNLPAGSYVYGVITENTRLMSRLIVTE